MVIISEKNYLAHYGVLRKSGRYPWGSGKTQNQRNRMFLDEVDGLKKEGMSEAEIAKGYGVSVAYLRALRSIAVNEQRQTNIDRAQRLKDEGNSNVAIGQIMGVGESTVRSWLAPGAKDKADIILTTSNALREELKTKRFLDIGIGTENYLNVSKEKLSAAVAVLQEEGWEVHPLDIPQAGTVHKTKYKVLCPPGTTQKELWLHRDEIRTIQQTSDDGGRSFYGLMPPLSVNAKRVDINYVEDGGGKADGVLYVRPGVSDLSLGNSRYAQVRVLVGKDRYLKGMAMYKEDLPDGVDIVFNTNKSKKDNSKLDVMKKIEEDPDNPFGTIIQRQIISNPGTPKAKVTSAMNIVNEEGSWSDWSRTISSQVLSKQSPALAKTQLNMTYESRETDLKNIQNLTNLTVRKKLLDSFADSADSASVHLKAAQLPRQGWHAILPIDSIPPGQVYAPNYKPGELVALIRYPHGGTFEIPELIVNNNHPESKRLIGGAKDAIGIHHSVAKRLSGADFDGDTVLVIPNNQRKIKSTPALEQLKDFDPQRAYPKYDGMTVMSKTRKGQEMGRVSNLITDMTIKGAPPEDIAKAIRHSMVVIDAEKHELNWKQSEKDNNIAALSKRYQGKTTGGASTIISRAEATKWVDQRRERRASEGGRVDPVTGRIRYVDTNATYVDKKGTVQKKQMTIKRLADEDDARNLLSNNPAPMEVLYANHSNKLKALANQARIESLNTPPSKYSQSAARVYKKEAQSLDDALALAYRGKPLERQAQLLTNTVMRAKKMDNPNMEPATEKKIKYQVLEEMRARTGASKHKITISDKEWEAIQSGAISNHKLNEILKFADMERVRMLATPKNQPLMTSTMRTRAMAMFASGYDRGEVAEQLGVSLSTLDAAVTGSEQ